MDTTPPRFSALHPETLAIHAGRHADPTGAISPPIHLSTTFAADAKGGRPHGYSYSRDDNPNRRALEQCIAALEGAAGCLAFSSGMAAVAALLDCMPPDRPRHLLIADDTYYGVRQMIDETDLHERLVVSEVDTTDLAAVERVCAAAPAAMVWLETPSNPLLKVTDIAAVAAIAHQTGAVVVVDNTVATPLGQNPLRLGADIVAHSVTKYIGGHSDVLLGAVAVRQAGPMLDRLRLVQKHRGGVPSPFECWLALRGMETLGARMRTQCGSALAVATFLAGHAGVATVHYPGLAADPGHALAVRQMAGFGAMVSFRLHGDATAAEAFTAAVRLFTRATSFGGAHSLIEHRGAFPRGGAAVRPGLLRLSIGLEHADDLIDDLAQALEAAQGA